MVEAAHSNLKTVTLELGGKSPNIIFQDADGKFHGTLLYILLNHKMF